MEQERRRAVAPQPLGPDEGDRDRGPVLRRGHEALRLETRRVVARDRGLLQHAAHARVHVVRQDGGRRDEGLVEQAERRRLEDTVCLGRHRVGRLGEGHRVLGPAVGVEETDAREGRRSFTEDEVAREDQVLLEHDVGAVRHELHPADLGRIVHGRAHEAEVAAAIVGTDDELAAAVIEEVLVVGTARGHQTPVTLRTRGLEETRLGRGVADGRQDEVRPGTRARHGEIEAFVPLFVDQGVAAGGRTQGVALEAIGPLGVILERIEEDLPVGGPGRRRDALDPLREQGARVEVLDGERVLAEAGAVGRIGQAAPRVVRDVEPERHEGLAARQLVEIERDLVATRGHVRGRASPSTVERVLQAGLGAHPVLERALAVRGRAVRLLDVTEHLAVERLLQRRARLHDRRGVGVLGLEVGADVGARLLAQPEVVVDAALAVLDLDVRDPARDRRARRRRLGGLPRAHADVAWVLSVTTSQVQRFGSRGSGGGSPPLHSGARIHFGRRV